MFNRVSKILAIAVFVTTVISCSDSGSSGSKVEDDQTNSSNISVLTFTKPNTIQRNANASMNLSLDNSGASSSDVIYFYWLPNDDVSKRLINIKPSRGVIYPNKNQSQISFLVSANNELGTAFFTLKLMEENGEEKLQGFELGVEP